jgi:AcrR family transcriptional regulator
MNSVTIHDIAGEIGVTEAAIYRHFSSKRAIYSLLLERWEESLLSTVRGEQYDSLPALENLERAFWALLSEVQSRQALSFIVIETIAFEGMRGLSNQVAAVITDYLEAIQNILERGVNEGVVRPDLNLDAAATTFFGMIQSTATLWALNDYSSPLAGQGAKMWEIFKRGVASDV